MVSPCLRTRFAAQGLDPGRSPEYTARPFFSPAVHSATSPTMLMKFKPSQSYSYTANYCEENIWKLAAHPDFQARIDECKILIISNLKKQCPIWQQRASLIHGDPVLWDYHVVLVHQQPAPAPTLIWDLDTLLDTPSPFDLWWQTSFPVLDELPQEYKPMFRLIEASVYLETLSSDRSHMRDERGTWRMPPPSWPPIYDGQHHNLCALIDMSREGVGELLDAHALQKRLASTTDT